MTKLNSTKPKLPKPNPTKFSPNEDLACFADQLEPVTLRRRGSTQALVIETAFRQQSVMKEMQPSGGAVLQTDATWQLQLPAEETPPQIGDTVIDQQKNRWTILKTEEFPLLGRWKCVCRELRIAHGCVDRVDIERAVWDDLGNGPEIVDWKYICMALPVKIQLDEMISDTSTNPPTQQMLFEIILGESIPLEPDDRFIAENGTSYRLLSLQQADRIDTLPVASVVQEEGA